MPPKKERDYHEFIDVFDPMIEALFDTVDDIRHSLVEEGWFGKEVTDDIVTKAERPDPNFEINHDLGNFYGMPDAPAEMTNEIGLDLDRRYFEKRQIGREELDRGLDLDL